jgi:type I restriction enzyme, S subunit
MSEAILAPKLRFPEFSREWVENSIEFLVKRNILEKPLDGNHGEIHPVSSDFVNKGIPFVMANDIKNGLIDFNNCKKITKEQADTLQKGFSYSGDVLITHKGSVGQVALVPAIDTEYIMLTPQVTYYRVKDKDIFSNLFLLQRFRSNSFQKVIKILSKGGTRPYIGITEQRKLKLTYPSKPEQQKIATFLTSVDTKIEQLSKKQELLSEYKKGLMQKIFSQELRFKTDDGSDYPDWEEKKLLNVLEKTSTGLNPRRNFILGSGNNYYVTIKNISNGKLDFSSCEKIDDEAMMLIANRSDLSKFDLIMSSIGNVGESYLLEETPTNWNINESVFMLRAGRSLLPKFLYYIITNEESKWYLESNSTGSSFKSIKLKELKLLPLKLPSIQEQQKIANFLSSIESKIEQIGKQLDETKHFKKALLQQMFV